MMHRNYSVNLHSNHSSINKIMEQKFTLSNRCINFFLPTVLKSFYSKSQPWDSNSVTTVSLRANAKDTILNKKIFYTVSLFMILKE